MEHPLGEPLKQLPLQTNPSWNLWEIDEILGEIPDKTHGKHLEYRGDGWSSAGGLEESVMDILEKTLKEHPLGEFLMELLLEESPTELFSLEESLMGLALGESMNSS